MRHSIHSLFYDQAEAHEAAERYEEALALYYQVHRWAPNDPDLWLRLGLLSFALTDPDWLRANGRESSHLADMATVNAELYLTRVVELAPDWAQGRFWRGWVRHKLYQDAEGARADMARAIAQQPNFPYAYAALGRLEMASDAGDLDAAEAWLRGAIARLPENGRFHYDLGTCLTRGNRLEAARQAFQQALDCQALPLPAGPGARHLARELHAEPLDLQTLVTRFYGDVMR